jgi:hypothetical protein
MYVNVPLDSTGRPLDASHQLTSEQAAAIRAQQAQKSVFAPTASAPAPTTGKQSRKGRMAAPEKSS